MNRNLLTVLLLCLTLTLCSDVSLSADSTFVLTADALEPYTPSYLGNGYLSLTTTRLATAPASSYMIRVYDQAPDDVPRIANLPAWNEIDVLNGVSWLNQGPVVAERIQNYSQSLSLYDATLETGYRWVADGRAVGVGVQSFVSRSNPNLAVVKLGVTPEYAGRMVVRFPLQGRAEPERWPLAERDSVSYELHDGWPEIWYPGHLAVETAGADTTGPNPRLWLLSRPVGRPIAVAQSAVVSWDVGDTEMQPDTEVTENGAALELAFEVSEGQTYTFVKYVAVVASWEDPEPLAVARTVAEQAAEAGFEAVWDEHRAAWHELWQTDIVIEGDAELQRLVRAMIYSLLSSVRAGTNFSLPPMGLSGAGYYGHIMWDADFFMLPPLVVLHPEIARSLVMFRYETLQAAKARAIANGYEGAMYPWQADNFGQESTPKFVWHNAEKQIHVTGDVALGQWWYFLATDDIDWLAQYGYPVIKAAAEFWMSRMTYNANQRLYEINDVVSVNDSLIGVDNAVYTNAVAWKTLEILTLATEALNLPEDPQWRRIMRSIYLPFHAGRKHHLDFEGASPLTSGVAAPLLSYPLSMRKTFTTKRRDLINAVRRFLEADAPPMKWITLYPIVAVEVNEPEAVNRLFRHTYEPYIRPPFYTLAERPGNDAVNFLTGAGGFLQQLIFGYTGLRFSLIRGLEPRYRPMLPDGIKALTLKNISVYGRHYDVTLKDGELDVVRK